MFRCQVSGKVSKSGERAFKLVTKTRVKDYFRRNKEGELVKIGQGTEIVEEKIVSKTVYDAAMAGTQAD